MKRVRLLAFILTVGALIAGAYTQAGAASSPQRPLVIPQLKNDLSPPLYAIPPGAATASEEIWTIPMGQLRQPAVGAAAAEELQQNPDPVLQDWHTYIGMPAPVNNFAGIGNLAGVLPPDTVGDVGPAHYIQMVNLHFAIWDKSGTLLYGPQPNNTLWNGFGGACEATNHGDPIVLYDHLADRWLMSQFALPSYPNGPFYECVAISQSSNPLGSWYRYAFQFSKMNDYPKFGVWPDAYYMSINQFAAGTGGWAGAGVAAMERSKMLVGQPAQIIFFDLFSANPNFGGMLPADLDGPAPPTGTPNYFVEADDNAYGWPTDSLRIWNFHVDWTTPANSTFGLSMQPNVILTTAPFDSNMCGFARNCIPQPGGAALDAISDRLMFRAQYRNFGTHQSMVLNHTVDADGSDHAGIRWYELRNSGTGWLIQQQGTYAPDANHRWMGSIAMDRQGNIGLGYSVSSTSVSPSIRYAGRLSGDPLGQLAQGETELIAGSGYQTHSSGRWGDYSMMGVDPVDDCTFWYTQEYYDSIGVAPWKTRIGTFKFPSCTSGPAGKVQGTVTNFVTNNPIAGATVATTTGGFTTTTNANGEYTLDGIPVGDYTLRYTAYGYVATTRLVSITEGATLVRDVKLNPAAESVVQGLVRDGSGHAWPLYARIDIAGYPGGPVYTNPVTGRYSVSLYVGTSYTFTVQAVKGGYNTLSQTVIPVTGGSTKNFSLTVDPTNCSAPGYGLRGIFEQFEGGATPNGWTIKDNAGTGGVWSFNNPGGRTNLTGGTGGFAIIDSDDAGSIAIDTEMISPTVNYTGSATATLEFDTDFNSWTSEVADVDVSNDGGTTWTNVWKKTGADYRGPHHELLDITALAAGQSNVKVRFHYYNASFEYWWEVDNVKTGLAQCQLLAGGLVVGNVYDANFPNPPGTPVVGVRITNGALGSATTDASGYYTIFSPAGARTLVASKAGYGNGTAAATVVLNKVVRKDFNLAAGRITANPLSVDVVLNVNQGLRTNRTVTLNNTGGRVATFTIRDSELGAELRPVSVVEQPEWVVKPFRQNFLTAEGLGLPDPPAAPPYAAGNVIKSWASGLSVGYGVVYDGAAGTVWVGSPAAGWGGTNQVLEYSETGTPTGRTHPFSWNPQYGPADMAYNWNTGRFWAMNVGSGPTNCIFEIDPASGYTGASICPGTGFAVSQRGLAYDPVSNTFFAGGWNDEMIHHFDTSGTILDSVNVGLAIAGLAYNPETQHLFVMTNDSPNPVYVLDAANNYAVVGQFSVSQGFGPYDGAGMEMACDGSLWAFDQNTKMVHQFESGETASLCGAAWLTESPQTGSIAKAASRAISLAFNATGLTLGNYRANVNVFNDTPYGALTVPVNFTVIRGPLTLFTPNGGEVISSGSTYAITWGALPSLVRFSLLYSLNNGVTWLPIAENLTGTSYEWSVPVPTANKSTCRVKVIGYDAAGGTVGEDASDANFTIEVVRLTAPNGGENLVPGTFWNIGWTTAATSAPVARVEIYYSVNGGTTWRPQVFIFGSNTGVYAWPVPDTPSTTARVKVLLKNAGGAPIGSDNSDANFTIQ